MKARFRLQEGYWYCKRMFVTGRGRTPEEAWEDMWQLYSDVVYPAKRDFDIRRVRC